MEAAAAALKEGIVTKERLGHASGKIEAGDDKRGTRVYRLRDAPIERMVDDDRLTDHEYEALIKLRRHWYYGGVMATLGSADLNRIYASDPASFSFMSKTEKQAWHRQKFREGMKALEKEEFWKAGIVVQNVVLNEQTLVVAGYCIGFKSEYRARNGATMRLKQGARELMRLWGIGPQRPT